jgi:hypothetical protein
MGERFNSFEANKSYLVGAVAQIDCGDLDGAVATLTRCHCDIDPEGLATPMDAEDPDYQRYQKLSRIVLKARDMVALDMQGARAELVSGLREFGWTDGLTAAAKAE